MRLVRSILLVAGVAGCNAIIGNGLAGDATNCWLDDDSAAICVLRDDDGVFVSSSRGSVEGDGTRSRPLRTLRAALERAIATQQPVFACADVFRESIVIQGRVTLIGGFECENGTWVRTDRH